MCGCVVLSVLVFMCEIVRVVVVMVVITYVCVFAICSVVFVSCFMSVDVDNGAGVVVGVDVGVYGRVDDVVDVCDDAGVGAGV